MAFLSHIYPRATGVRAYAGTLRSMLLAFLHTQSPTCRQSAGQGANALFIQLTGFGAVLKSCLWQAGGFDLPPQLSSRPVNRRAASLQKVQTMILHQKTELEQTVDDLSMLVLKLVRKLPKEAELRAQAVDYLSRKGLIGSPLR